jgi:hypothetical protein
MIQKIEFQRTEPYIKNSNDRKNFVIEPVIFVGRGTNYSKRNFVRGRKKTCIIYDRLTHGNRIYNSRLGEAYECL